MSERTIETKAEEIKKIIDESEGELLLLSIENKMYLSIRYDSDEELVELVERVEKAEAFPRMLQLAFFNGMVDGITQYKKQISKLGTIYGKAVKLGDRLLSILETEAAKPPEA